VEDAVLTVEVKPITTQAAPAAQAIGQVVLNATVTAEQVIERLGAAETMCLTKEMRYKPRLRTALDLIGMRRYALS